MKVSKRVWAMVLVCLSLGMGTMTYAREYQHSMGVVVGSFNGFSYKGFFGKNLVLQTDLAFGLQATQGTVYLSGFKGVNATVDYWDFVVNPNILYQDQITNHVWYYAGGGVSLGVAEEFTMPEPYGKFGINAMAGLEYVFDDVPLSLSLDFRPGYGMLFGDVAGFGISMHMFDWRLALGVRYTL